MAFPLLVLDAPAALALLLAGEEGREVADTVERVISQNGQIFVPELFWYELGNAILSAERQQRIAPEESESAAEYYARLPFVSHYAAERSVRDRTMELARRHGLSYSDASYLELALRYRASLKSLDGHLLDLKPHYPLIL